MTLILRDYQQHLKHAIHAAWQAGARNVLGVLPCGGGKTAIFSNIIAEETRPTVAIAHRTELVSQISVALARNGVRHKVIGPDTLVRTVVQCHMATVGVSYYDATSRNAVASVMTLTNRDPNDAWFRHVGLWVTDECFPAGTLVDGCPIETLRVGDIVTAFDENTGTFHERAVARVFKNKAPKHMVTVQTGHHVLQCTSGHPFWTRRGWVEASSLATSDEVLCHGDTYLQRMQRDIFQQKEGSNLLREGVSVQMAGSVVIGCDGGNKSKARIGADEEKKSHANGEHASESECDVTCHEAQTVCARRERQRTDGRRNDGVHNAGTTWLRDENYDPHRDAARIGVPPALQAGHSKPHVEDCCGDRWLQPLGDSTKSTRREEDCASGWTRVESVEIYERASAVGSDDGFVYNIEVDEFHTYVANGIVVHNCHHLLADNVWGKAVAMFPNARGLGVTATPLRADGKGLGRHADGVIDAMVEGPGMRALIDARHLSEYRIFAPPSDLDLSNVTITASGDYSPEPLRAAVHRSHIHGDVVTHYLRVTPGKLGITFAVDIESATELAAAFRASGVPAEVLTGSTQPAIRYKLLQKFSRGEIKQLCVCDIVNEGFDLPSVEVCSMARPTESYGLFVQQFGRAIRPLDGKHHAYILDHVSNVLRHGLPDAPRVWTLDRRERRSSSANDQGVIPIRICPACAGAYERVRTACPYCGNVPEPVGRGAPEQVDGDLGELSPEVLARMRGEIAAVDGSFVPVPQNATPMIAAACHKRHRARQQAQHALRERMALWGGLRTAAGDSLAMAQKRFYLQYGVSVADAQTLNATDAAALMERIKL